MPRAAMLLALLVPLVACRDGPTAPDLALGIAVTAQPDALRTINTLVEDPLVRAIARARRAARLPTGPATARLGMLVAPTAADDLGDQVVLQAALELIDEAATSDTVLH